MHQKTMEEENIDHRKGLTEELFALSTSIVLTINVDLFCIERKREYRWFDTLPEDFLMQHRKLYRDIFSKFFEGGTIQ